MSGRNKTTVQGKAEMNTLVSFCLTSYNQKALIMKALEAALAQDYSPLEIIVADDCSTDGSQAAIQERVDRYRKEDGKHTVVLQFNEKNLGIIKNREGLFALARGKLCVNADGDDISLPNRVSRIVDEWEHAGAKHTIISHGYVIVNEKDDVVGSGRPYLAEYPLGAINTYDRRVYTEFPKVSIQPTMEDQVFSKRALMIGEQLRFDEPLIWYRDAGGFSTKSSHRERRARIATYNYHSAEQSAIDLEFVKHKLPPGRYSIAKKMVDRQLAEYKAAMGLTAGKTFLERWRGLVGLWRLGWFKGRSNGTKIYATFYLPPNWLSDGLFRIYKKMI